MHPDCLREDAWLTGILGKPAFNLVDVPAFLDSCGAVPQGCFVSVKVDVERLEEVRALEGRGFRLMDTALIFEAQEISGVSGRYARRIRAAVPRDRQQVVEIARRSFIKSRFYNDSLIGVAAAERIHIEWVLNYFSRRRGDLMLVDETSPGIISGFMTLLDGRDGGVTIDLVAVREDHRRAGVGRELISAIPLYMKPQRVHVTTQAANVTVVRLYERLGFCLARAAHVLHFHGV